MDKLVDSVVLLVEVVSSLEEQAEKNETDSAVIAINASLFFIFSYLHFP